MPNRTDRQRRTHAKRVAAREAQLPRVTVTVHPNGQAVLKSTMSKEKTIAALIAVVARYVPQAEALATPEDEDGGYAIQTAADLVEATS